uniref:Sodium/potassium-transporting ATPase subunit beta-1-interacting protein n=1 Tax=Acrobeloides nanus TaxID=290746 RepID=A0A914CBS2_9BILA
MCESRPSGCLICLLVFWLLITILREAFDLIGKLWIPVIYNLLQILSCISGLFAVCQYRLSLLIALSISCSISLMYNVLIILWYNGIFGDSTRPLLSLGLPFSYSFFLRYTPFCQSYFNLTTSQWVQRPCVLPYYNAESLQALIHAIIAVLTMILSLVLACSRRHSGSSERRTKTVSIDFSGTGGSGSACLMGNTGGIKLPSRQAPSKIAESISSGYLNSSYESPEIDSYPTSKPEIHSNPARNYERYSGRNIRSKRLPKTPSSSAMYMENVSPETNEDNYNEEHARASIYEERKESKVYGNSENKSASQLRTDSIADSSASSEETKDTHDGIPSYTKVKQRSGSARSFNAPAYESFQQHHRRKPSTECLTATNGSDFVKKDLNRDEQRRGSSNNLSSLVSFDPKSSTLIRVKEHLDEVEDAPRKDPFQQQNVYREVYMCPKRSNSQDSVPSIDAPVLSQDLRINPDMDSGHPSSSANSGASPDWSQVGISHPRAPPTTTIPSRPLGYDPALCDIQPPRPLHRVVPPPSTSVTAFPVEHQRRSLNATYLSTAIPLISSAPSTSNRPTHIGKPEVGQRLMAYSAVPEERERTKSSVFPSTNNGLLV